MTPAFLFIMSRHDISDEKWAVIGPMLEKKKTETRGRKRKDDRLMFNFVDSENRGSLEGFTCGIRTMEYCP